MLEELDLTAKWGDRRETIEECAQRVANCLKRLSDVDDAFAVWYYSHGAPSPAIALQRKVTPTIERLGDLLSKGRYSPNPGGPVRETFGYGLTLWNGLEDDAGITLEIECGAYPSLPVPFINECRFRLPNSGPAAERLGREDQVHGMMLAFVESWDPDIAWVSTFKVWHATFPHDHRGAWVGWLTYLSNRYGELPPLPEKYAIEPVGQLGRLILIRGIDRLASSNAPQVEAVKYLGDTLRAAGFLGAAGRQCDR